MVTIILPGYSVHNKEWLEETAQKIGIEGEIRPVYWEHWTDSDIKFDAKEKARLIDSIAGMRVIDLVTKSIGTLVASYMIQKNPEKIHKVIFCGIPINDLAENDKVVIKSALRLISPENIICFQNDEDPHGGFDQVKSFLLEVSPDIKVIIKDREDHEYPYYEEYRKFLVG